MTAAEVRGTALAYYRIRELLDQPLPDDTRDLFNTFLQSVAERCHAVTENSGPSRWARGMVGPVLAAALGAALYLREDAPTPNIALRIFGLLGERAFTPHAAWKLMTPYLREPIVNMKALADIRRACRLRLKVSFAPSPAEMLEELTRPRSGVFPEQVTGWLVEYFREHPDSDTPYGEMYRTGLAELRALNARNALVQHVSASALGPRPSQADWQALIEGRLPQSAVEIRAAQAVVRHFITDYREQWNRKHIGGSNDLPAMHRADDPLRQHPEGDAPVPLPPL